jgi:hypothetical protein
MLYLLFVVLAIGCLLEATHLHQNPDRDSKAETMNGEGALSASVPCSSFNTSMEALCCNYWRDRGWFCLGLGHLEGSAFSYHITARTPTKV